MDAGETDAVCVNVGRGVAVGVGVTVGAGAGVTVGASVGATVAVGTGLAAAATENHLSTLFLMEDLGITEGPEGGLSEADKAAIARDQSQWIEGFDGDSYLHHGARRVGLSGPIEPQVDYREGQVEIRFLRALDADAGHRRPSCEVEVGRVAHRKTFALLAMRKRTAATRTRVLPRGLGGHDVPALRLGEWPRGAMALGHDHAERFIDGRTVALFLVARIRPKPGDFLSSVDSHRFAASRLQRFHD